jgi:hypothetical protein
MDWKIELAIEFITLVFFAGGFYVWIRLSILNIKKDLNGIGNKSREQEKAAARRYHNTSLAIMVCAPPAKEDQVSKLLKEQS